VFPSSLKFEYEKPKFLIASELTQSEITFPVRSVGYDH